MSARGEFIVEFYILEKVLRECFDAADWMNFAETTDVPPFCQHTNRPIDPSTIVQKIICVKLRTPRCDQSLYWLLVDTAYCILTA